MDVEDMSIRNAIDTLKGIRIVEGEEESVGIKMRNALLVCLRYINASTPIGKGLLELLLDVYEMVFEFGINCINILSHVVNVFFVTFMEEVEDAIYIVFAKCSFEIRPEDVVLSVVVIERWGVSEVVLHHVDKP